MDIFSKNNYTESKAGSESSVDDFSKINCSDFRSLILLDLTVLNCVDNFSKIYYTAFPNNLYAKGKTHNASTASD